MENNLLLLLNNKKKTINILPVLRKEVKNRERNLETKLSIRKDRINKQRGYLICPD